MYLREQKFLGQQYEQYRRKLRADKSLHSEMDHYANLTHNRIKAESI